MFKSIKTRMGRIKTKVSSSSHDKTLTQTPAQIQQGTLSTASEPYVYFSINGAAEEIRVVELLPGQFSDEIRIRIRKLILSNKTTEGTGSKAAEPAEPNFKFGYEAISYVWGSAENRAKITVIDEKTNTNSFLEITRNLAGALPYLRDKRNPRTLWIDAICINQQDLAERSEQVMKMGIIYEWADRVVVWLGPPNTETQIAMDVLSDLGRRVTVDWNLNTEIWHDPIIKSSPYMDSQKKPINLEMEIPYNEKTQNAIVCLLSTQWFERLWVWQEIHLANSKAILLNGNTSMSWIHFRDALYCLDGEIPNYGLDLQKLITRRLDFCDMQDNIDFNPVFRFTQNLMCSEPRDRIYAVQGVLLKRDSEYTVLKPDYADGSEIKIGMELVINCVHLDGDLGILELCNLGQNHGILPTWVPNFFGKNNFAPRALESGFAAAKSSAEIERYGDYKLKIKGLKCNSSIIAVEKITANEQDDFDNIALGIRKFWNLIPGEAGKSDSAVFKERLSSFSAVLLSRAFSDSYEPPDEDKVSSSECEICLLEILKRKDKSSKEFSEDTEGFLTDVWNYAQGRCFFVTDDGKFGLGGSAATHGDTLNILMGSDFPFILRPLEGERTEYQVVGPCYCTGLMDGEAFLGPLPNHQKYVHSNTELHEIPAFLDTRTGEMRYEDPRLGELPNRWRRNKYGEKDWEVVFVNEDTGEERDRNPRLASMALRKRGVKIEDIVLV